MFAKGRKVKTDLKLWHKRIGHINLQKLKGMQLKGVIIGYSLDFYRKSLLTLPTSTSSLDSRASNHMTSHEDWFWELRKLDQHGYVETEDDTTHLIRHIGNVPFRNDDKQTYLKNVLHVPTITKNLVSIG